MAGSLSQGIWQSTSLEKMEKIKEDQRKDRIVLQACRLQLKSDKFPKHCFSNKEFYKLFQKYFDQKCMEANWSALNKMIPFLKDENMSPDCLKKIAESKKIQSYQSQDQIVEKALREYLDIKE